MKINQKSWTEEKGWVDVRPQAAVIGFYSYGELCPTSATGKKCQLHNQTMTIATFRES